MQLQDVERIARLALRELGAGDVPLTITAEPQPDRWRVAIGGNVQTTLSIRAGSGTTPQYVREQIFDQFNAR
ncbi:MAG TPA: hypothetical protein VL262_00130 [Vicinamibacterales bacterium]|nr:hypothetical protein [Vicinamibacterales bacterium]